MGDYILLEDGRAWAGASWLVSAVLREIAVSVNAHPKGGPLAQWLRARSTRPNGLMSFDLRGLDAVSRRLFWRGAHSAFQRRIVRGPEGWHDLSFYPGYLDRFHDLLRMVKAIQRREPPERLNHFSATIPYDGTLEDLSDTWEA
jgi:hypothetical protein